MGKIVFVLVAAMLLSLISIIPSMFEIKTIYAEPLYLSYEIFVALINSLDIDRDGLWNWWETSGVDINNDGIIDLNLPALGAKMDHKDLFIELDYMTFHKPRLDAINAVIASFSKADVSNPDGTKGINLHILVDDEITHTNTIDFVQLQNIKFSNFGTDADRLNLNFLPGIRPAKLIVYHYGVFGHDQPYVPDVSLPGSSGNSYFIPNMDFVVTLGGGSFWSLDPTTGHRVGSKDQQEGTLMHEFGHNLGLRHGGIDGKNCKPNYLSVMNYLFQFSTPIGGRPLDYSRSILNPLDEVSLNENIGVKTSDPPNLLTAHSTDYPDFITKVVPTGVPIDWDQDGLKTNPDAIYNINYFKNPFDCPNSLDNLIPFDDWAKIKYSFIPILGDSLGAQMEEHLGNRSVSFAAFNNTYTAIQTVKRERVGTPELTFNDVRNMTNSLARGINLAIQQTSNSDFRTPGSASTLKNTFSLDLSSERSPGSVISLIKKDKPADAINKLKSVKSKMDGHFGGVLNNDDIPSIRAQQNIVPLIDNLILVLSKQQ